MRIGEVIGRVTLSRAHSSVVGATWRIAVPLSWTGVARLVQGTSGGDRMAGRGEPLVVYDEWGASQGALIAFSEGAEAGAPFDPPKPLDAYCVGILDALSVLPSP
jgi:ethanolamine utilization protein EutN